MERSRFMTNETLKDLRFAKAADVMTKTVAYIDGNQSVANAIKLMREKGVSSLVVNRRGEEDTWGMVTRKDVVNKIVDPGKDPHEARVFEIMSKPLITVSPGLALKYCARLINHAGIRRAIVFDGNEIVGILSDNDIFNAIKI
jgi:CBS domain-containing protein